MHSMPRSQDYMPDGTWLGLLDCGWSCLDSHDLQLCSDSTASAANPKPEAPTKKAELRGILRPLKRFGSRGVLQVQGV